VLEPATPFDEASRLATLRGLEILDTPPEERFNRLTRLAQHIFGVPVALVSLVDSNRQWFKSCQGLDVSETPRSISFCGHAILDDQVFIVPDTLLDPRFADNPLVTGAPNIRFYVGAPLKLSNGQRVGTLCVIDSKPCEVASAQLAALRDLAQCVSDELERDVRQEYLAEQALIQAKYGSIIASSDDAIMSKNLDGIITSWNPAAERLFGYTEQEAIGQPMLMLIPKERADEEASILARIRSGQRIHHFETIRIRKDGSKVNVSVSISPLLNETGDVMGASKIVCDITERKRAAQAQYDNEARLAAILDNVLDGIITINEQGIVESFNKAAEKIFGCSAAEVTGQNIKMLMPEPYHSEHDSYLHNHVSTGVKKIIGIGRQVVGRRRDGTTFPMDLAVSAMQLGGKRMFTGIVRDITERVKTERMKSEFISTVSHELRTPLTSIRGSLGLLAGGLAGELPAQVKSLIDIAHKNSERLIRLVNDILDMEKIEAGKMEFALAPTRLIPLLHQAIEGNRAYAEQFGVVYELSDALPDVDVNLDADRWQQVLSNLLSNAAKFSPAGDRVILSATGDGERVRITVSDHGSGIPAQFQSHIFEKFSQADSSDTRKKGGTGLGLSITKAIVEQMGGRIGFESQPDVLTTFWVEFPVWHKNLVPESGHTGAGKRVLVCEDDQDIASLLCLMLEQAGLSADVAGTAMQAKQMLALYDYAAMTLDLGLPDQDGLSLIRELRAAEKTATLPIIVVSANAEKGSRELSGDAFSIVDWIKKPIDRDRLESALMRAVERFDATRANVLHVEDDPDISRVVRAIVGGFAGMDNASSLAEARIMLKQKRYDLVIMDITLPDGSGMDLLNDLNSSTPPIPVMVFSAHEMGLDAIRQVGASLVKSRTENAQLLATIKHMIGVE
jgi:PAS domain S-box-containing protein